MMNRRTVEGAMICLAIFLWAMVYIVLSRHWKSQQFLMDEERRINLEKIGLIGKVKILIQRSDFQFFVFNSHAVGAIYVKHFRIRSVKPI